MTVVLRQQKIKEVMDDGNMDFDGVTMGDPANFDDIDRNEDQDTAGASHVYAD